MAIASDLFMNFTGTTVSYGTTPTVIDIGEVTDIEFDEDIKQEIFFGDNRKRPKLIRNTEEKNTLKIVGGNIAKLASIPKDVPLTIETTLCDALNGTGIGALTITLENAMRGKITNKGSNNKFATGDVTFTSFGDDEDASPLTITPVTS